MLDDLIYCYKKLIEINPKYKLAFYELGHTYKKKQMFQDAIYCYNK